MRGNCGKTSRRRALGTRMSGEEALPSDVDVVVLGTGLPESIIAAACARSGLSVLHLDRNDYYGGVWSSFHLQSIAEWVDRMNGEIDAASEGNYTDHTLEDGEELVPIGRNQSIGNVHLQWHIVEPETTESEQNGDMESDHPIKRDMEKNWRRFSIDLLPKVLLSRGAMVQVICDSEVSKYCEFKCVDRLLCLSAKANYAEGALQELQVVPCSRSEIFQSEAISMIEKRRIMKFLTSCMQWHEKPDEIDGWSDFADKPFDDFIESRGITGNLKGFVADTIGILRPNATAKEGLKAVYRFMESVGRFGDSPFLWTLYGSGELPQCFCRLCAVYGGIYCLKQPIDALILRGNRVMAVLTKGQRIKCRHVIMDPSYLPRRYSNDKERRNVLQRAILLTNRSLLNDAEKEHISLLNLMRLDSDASARLLEVGFEACAAPRGYFVSHLTAHGKGSACKTLKPIVSRLFKDGLAVSDSEDTRPPLLWSLYFDVNEPIYSRENIPSNLRIVSGVDANLDYDETIAKTRALFEELWSDRDFLPRSLSKEDDHEEQEQAENGGQNNEVQEENPEIGIENMSS
uniref:Rab proteins geranylgeranyltransferase component A n=1 Tax=Parascaris univalens TaxID=6257 RepID=A0A915AIX1_PARUN